MKIKEEIQAQKELALRIRKTRIEFKEKQRKGSVVGSDHHDLDSMVSEYRHTHIALCLARGTPYEMIENPRENNKPNMNTVELIMKGFE